MSHFHCENCTVRSGSIFSELGREDMVFLNEIKQCKFYNKGEYLFKEGDDPNGIYCLRSGKIKVSKIGADGREQVTHLVHAGQTLGHRALFAGDLYSGSAVALENAHVCFIPKSSLRDIVKENPGIVWTVAKLLAVELREAEDKMTHLAQDSAKSKLIEALKSMIETYGYKSDKMTISLDIKRQDLANIAGTTRETITRNLYQLQLENKIRINGKKISILDKEIFQS